MIEYRFTCDHCKSPSSAPPIANESLVTMTMGTQEIHVCTMCIPALANFFPNVDRNVFARYVHYDATIEVNPISEELAKRHFDLRVSSPGKELPHPAGPERVLPTVTKRTTFVTVPAHTLGASFKPTRFVIDSDRPEDWLVLEIQSGGKSQYSQMGDVPGDQFAPTATPTLDFRTCAIGENLEVRVRYVGKNPEGSHFKAHFDGKATGFPPSQKIVPKSSRD